MNKDMNEAKEKQLIDKIACTLKDELLKHSLTYTQVYKILQLVRHKVEDDVVLCNEDCDS